jgi:hypothetical protein
MKIFLNYALFIYSMTALSAMAATFNLDATGQEPLYRIEIPKIVYQYSRSEHLNDLTIHNASGEQVPYALLPYEVFHPLNTSIHDTKSLTIYAISEYQLTNPGVLNIKIENADNRNIDPTVSLKINSQNKDSKNIYLIDAGKEHPALESLSVEWLGGDGLLLSLDILASDDLKTWSYAGHAVLLKTTTDGNALLQNNITLDTATKKRFLQIRPADNNTFLLTKINAIYSKLQTITPDFHWQDLQLLNREMNKKTGEINLDFESPGRYAISHLRVALPQTNTITNVNVLARKSSNDPWQFISTAALYHVTKQGKSYTNPDIALYPTSARYWRLQFNQSNGGLGNEDPKLSSGWLPDTLIWNARGKAPFTLQVGNNPSFINHVEVDRLISIDSAAPELKIKKIQELPQSNLNPVADATKPSDAQITNAWKSPPDYKRWLLWAGLLIGVMLLAGMAYSLFKSDNTDPPNK